MADHYPFPLRPLPYSYDALEPYLSAHILRLHHDKHLAGHVETLNAALAEYPRYQGCSLTRLLSPGCAPPALCAAVCRGGGGVFNHDLYFDCLGPGCGGEPVGRLGEAIRRQFGGFGRFRVRFLDAALARCGSGWAWLASDVAGRLRVLSTRDQDTPLPLCPILAADLWEHAYYLQYQNRRPEYLDAWFHAVNWPRADQRYRTCLGEPAAL